jgi:hypothetical protein
VGALYRHLPNWEAVYRDEVQQVAEAAPGLVEIRALLGGLGVVT